MSIVLVDLLIMRTYHFYFGIYILGYLFFMQLHFPGPAQFHYYILNRAYFVFWVLLLLNNSEISMSSTLYSVILCYAYKYSLFNINLVGTPPCLAQ